MSPAQRSAPALALIRAFAPGSVDHLIICRSDEWRSLTFEGEKIAIEYALPDAAARRRGFELVELARGPAGADIPVRSWTFADITAEVRGDRLKIEALAIRD